MKIRNKLILSCAALAAVATTAVSTTFAWYTSNTEVKAEGITAGTQENADATLLISKTGHQKDWHQGVTFSMSANNMVPVAYDSTNDEYLLWDSTNNTTTSEGAQDPAAISNGIYSGAYVSFMLYFKSGTTDSLNVGIKRISLVNTSEDSLPTRTAQTTVGLGSTEGTAYSANLFRALTFATNAGSSMEVADGYANQASSATRRAYNVETNYMTAGSDTLAGSFNAHQYYDEIKGTDIASDAADLTTPNQSESLTTLGASDSTTDLAAAISLGQTGEGAAEDGGLDNILAVRFDLYLDGWDVACFDACQEQTFTLDLQFTVIS